MTIDKQTQREAAEKALPAMKRLLMMPNDELFDEALLNVDGDVDAANAFNLLAWPETMLALLDELEAAEQRIAKLESRTVTDWIEHDGKWRPDSLSTDELVYLKTRKQELKIPYPAGKVKGWMHTGGDMDVMAYKLASPQASIVTAAAADVLAERQRQQSVEGWTPEHDDLHDSGELAGAAACYAHYTNARGWVFPTDPGNYQSADEPNNWPWDPAWWKPTNPRRDLVKAGALILAEIERIDRAAGIGEGE